MPAYIWYPTFIGLTLGFSFMNLSPLTEQFMALFGVGYAGLSLFLSGIFWAHSMSQIPAGLLADRIGLFRGTLFAASLGVAANILPFLAPSNLYLGIAARFGLGICTGMVFICMLKVIGSLAPPDAMAKAQGISGGAFGFGSMLPYFILPYLGEAAWAFSYLLNAAMYAAAIACLFFLPRKRLSARRTAAAPRPGYRRTLVVLFSSRELWILGCVHGLCYGTLNNLGQWLPSILADLAGPPLAAWSLATTLVLFLGSCSRSLSGIALKAMSRTTAVNGVLFLIFLLYCAMGISGNLTITLALGLALAVTAGFTYGAVFTMGARVLPPAFMGTALGLLNSVANLVNVGLTLLFGALREHTGSFNEALILAGLAGLAAFLFFRTPIARLDARVE